MEFITILLSGLLLIVSPVGIVVDRLAENAIRDRLYAAEDLVVRADNAPNFQLVGGKLDKLRIAGRGISPTADLRLAEIELETDTIDLDIDSLRSGRIQLDAPAQGAMRLAMTEADLNRFLQSDQVDQLLANIRIQAFDRLTARTIDRYRLLNPVVELLGNDRVRVQLDLLDLVLEEKAEIQIDSGLGIVNGQSLQLIDPDLMVDGSPAPQLLVQELIRTVNTRFSLRRFEAAGLTARVLDLGVSDDQLDLAVFLRLEPSAALLGNQP